MTKLIFSILCDKSIFAVTFKTQRRHPNLKPFFQVCYAPLQMTLFIMSSKILNVAELEGAELALKGFLHFISL